MSPTDSHPSARWTQRAFTADRGTDPADPDRFAGLMAMDRFPLASGYDPAWVWTNKMGPNVLWLTDYVVPGDAADTANVVGPDGVETIGTFHSDRWWRALWQASDRIEVCSAERLP